MKRIISLLLATLLCFAVCGCKEEPVVPPDSENISELKLYIDNSYEGSDLLLYAIYKVSATDKDIEFFYYTQGQSSVGSGAVITANDLNSYYDLFSANEAVRKPFEITALKSPSEGQLIKAGESAEFISAFFISKRDITEGGKLVLTLKATHGFEEKEEVSQSSITYIDSAEALARQISPDGMTEEEKAAAEEIEEISSEEQKKIEEALTGSWSYTINEETYEMTFKEGKYTETKAKGEEKPKTTATGSYSIRKKVILVTLKDKSQVRIPYTFENDKLTVGTPKTSE